MGKKKFIDKKNSATFQLLARDSSDPNCSGPSGDRVFVRIDNNAYSVDNLFDESNDAVSVNDPNSIFADSPDDYDDEDGLGDGFSGRGIRSPLPPAAAAPLPDSIRREILELGFPDDGYNYLIHLREIKNTGGGSAYYHNPKAKLDQLPRDVKAYDASRLDISNVYDESNEGAIYSVASKTVVTRVQKAVDPEVVALLDDCDLSELGSEVEDLEEDFVVKANLPDEQLDAKLDKKLNLVEKFEVNLGEINKPNTSRSQENVANFAGRDEVGNHILHAGENCTDEKPRVCRLLDEQFDLIELQEYGTEIGEEYGDFVAEEDECYKPLAEKLNHAFKEHMMDDLELDGKYKVPSDLLHDREKEKDIESLESAVDVIRRCREYAEQYESENRVEHVFVIQESSDESEVWDCETIVSTYSNLDNHPGKIEAPLGTRKKKLVETVLGASKSPSKVISLKGKEKLPVDFLPQSRKPAVEKVKDVNSSRTDQQKRKQHGQESKEEKKERKASVKEERREARRIKKEIKGLYRCEAQRAQKVAAFTAPSTIHLM